MNDKKYSKEIDLFHAVSKRLLEHVKQSASSNVISRQKTSKGDFATAIDISCENIVVEEIKKLFTGDDILAEENYSETAIGEKRIWIIDPICGTNNLGREMPLYCTNIALADKGMPVAACVVDYSTGDYYWSVGGNQLFKNNTELIVFDRDIGLVIDIDYGAVDAVDKNIKLQHSVASKRLVLSKDVMLVSLNTSLSFLNVAIGKIDGAINVKSNPWDACASAFLTEQSGGILSDLYGQPWRVNSNSLIIARKKSTHKLLVDSYNN